MPTLLDLINKPHAGRNPAKKSTLSAVVEWGVGERVLIHCLSLWA